MATPLAEIVTDRDALARVAEGELRALTAAATLSFSRAGLTDAQRAANRRIVDIAEASCRSAAENENQLLATAILDGRLAGYVIATRHAADDLELDWLMVHPDFQGTGIAAPLMRAGMEWLGGDRPQWLGVIRDNERAIKFYRRFGFEIDPLAATAHAVPHWVMRRPPQPADAGRACP